MGREEEWCFDPGSAIITSQAWITPGIQPRIVRTMLRRSEPLQPRRRRTARGGRKIAIMASQQPILNGRLVCGFLSYVSEKTYEDHGCGSVQRTMSSLCAAGLMSVVSQAAVSHDRSVKSACM